MGGCKPYRRICNVNFAKFSCILYASKSWRNLQHMYFNNVCGIYPACRSHWSRGLRRRSMAARLLRSWVWIPPGTWMFVCCECCALSGRGFCDELITRPEESYQLWCVVVCYLEKQTSWMRRPRSTRGGGLWRQKKKNVPCMMRNSLGTPVCRNMWDIVCLLYSYFSTRKFGLINCILHHEVKGCPPIYS